MINSDAKLGALVFVLIACLVYGLKARPFRAAFERATGSSAVSALTERDAPMLLLLDVARRSGPNAGG